MAAYAVRRSTSPCVGGDTRRITVRSPKTEHHPGGESRVVPLFPELRPYLEKVWDQAVPGTERVISRYRDTNVNLRTQLCKIIDRAGLVPWPKLFQNLRATRQTELAEKFPAHVVCAWIGNTRAVAGKHYLQITSQHFDQASREPSNIEAAQNPAQQSHATARDDSQPKPGAQQKAPVLQGLAMPCDIVYKCIVGRAGLEPATNRL